MTAESSVQSVAPAPSTRARFVGIFLIVFSLLHFFSFFYLAIYYVRFPTAVKVFAAVNGYTVRGLFESIPVLRAVELVMSVALLLLGVGYILASVWQKRRDYRGVRLDKALRITSLSLNGVYACLLLFADEELLFAPEFAKIQPELKEILFIYTILILVLVAVLVFGLVHTFHVFKKWGDREHFPKHYPQKGES